MFNDNTDLSDSPPCTEAERTELRNEASSASLINPNLASTLQNVTFMLSETLTTTILAVLDFKCIWDLLLYIKRIIAKKKKPFWSWGCSSHIRVLDYHAWGPELDPQYHTCWVWWSMPVMEGKTDHFHSHSKFQFPTISGRQGPLETWAHPPLPILGSLQSHLKTIVRNWAGEVQQLPRTAVWFPALLLGHSQSQGTPGPGESSPFFWPPLVPGMLVVLTYKQSKTHICIKKTLKI